LAGGATGLTLLLMGTLPVLALPETLPLLGVVIVALTWGAAPSLLAVLVGPVLLEAVLLPTSGRVFGQAGLAGVHAGLFGLLCLCIGLLASQYGCARRRAAALAEALGAEKDESEQERQRLRALLEVLPVPIALVDREGRFVEYTPANQALWKDQASWARSLAEVPAYPARRPDTGQPVAREELPLVRALTRGESTLNEELEFEAPNGQRKILLNSATPIRDASGAIRGAAGLLQDITERKRLEEALRQAQQDAEARARELEAIFDALTDGLLVYDADGRILRSNRAASQFLGFEAHPEFAALPWQERAIRYAPRDAESQPVAPEDLAVSRLLRGEVLTGVHTAEDCLQTPDGREVFFRMTGRPLRSAEGAIVGAVGIARDETERRRLERQVAEHAAQLEAIFESIADGLIVTDAQGRVVHMNQASRMMLLIEHNPTGFTIPELEGLAGFSARTAEGHPLTEAERPINRYLEGEILTREHRVDLLLQTRDGRETFLNNSEVIGCVEVIRDVTEQRRLEQQVAKHAAQLEAILESITDGLIVTDSQGRLVHLNAAYRTLVGLEGEPTGVTLPALQAMAGHALLNEEGDPITEAERPVNRILQGEVLTGPKHANFRMRTRAGREVHINVSGALIHDSAGQRLGAVQVIRDVTTQRHLEQQTRDTLNALLAMAEALVEAPFQGTAASASEAPESTYVARRLAELTQNVLDCRYVGIVAVEPGTGKTTPITLVGVSPEHEQRWRASWDEHSRLGQYLTPGEVDALRTGEPILVTRVQAPVPRGRDLVPGAPSVLVPMRMGETLVGMLRVEGGTTEEAALCPNRKILIDAVARLGALVLERERLLPEREEARANELAVRQTQAEMETFLGMAGHELKNPLTSIKLALQLLERRLGRRREGEPDAAHAPAPFMAEVVRAAHQAERLERLVNELLDVSRIHAGKLELRLAPTDLATIVREAVDEQREAHPERTLLLQFAPPQKVPVVADTDRLGQVVTNYLTNALKYSPADRPVEVGLEVEQEQARVWVRDQGPGLPPEVQDRIWERFHRVPGIQVQSGTGVGLGLGLHICRTIVERHGGQVGVESAPGYGSTFWFTVPFDSQEGGERH
jgi:PAS domain S-box-containing protein